MAGDKIHPVLAGACVGTLGGEDFHRVTTGELGIKGNQPLVDFSPHGPVTDFCVNGVGKINGCRPSGQAHNLALGGENVEFLSPDFIPQGFQELCGVRRFLLPIGEVSKPSHVLVLRALLRRLSLGGQALFVFPVRCYPKLCPLVHVVGANLYFDRATFGAIDRGV